MNQNSNSNKKTSELLYKYKSISNLEYLFDIIKNKRFFLPNREILNDPLEGICDMKFGFSGCSYYVNTPKLPSQYENIVNSYGILSLSEDAKNILMWSHYADIFKGVCFEIKSDNHLKTARPVVYKNDVIKAQRYKNIDECAIASFMQKHEGWSYEKEWRIISKIENKQRYLQLDNNEITRVFIGYNIPTVTRNIIADVCINEGIDVQIAYVNPYIYSVEFMELEKFNDLIGKIETAD